MRKLSALAIVAVFALAACGSSDDTDAGQQSQAATPEATEAAETGETAETEPAETTSAAGFDGTWTTSKDVEAKFVAIISGDHITVDYANDDGSDAGPEALYWDGTFPAAAADPGTIVSQGDTTKMASALLASQDTQKTFSHEDGTLSFEFSMMGDTERVTLTRM